MPIVASTARTSVCRPRGRAETRRCNDEPRDVGAADLADKIQCVRLARLVPLWPWEVEAASEAGRLRLLSRLRRALRDERRRGLAGHWAYDLARHRQLLDAYREIAAASAQSRVIKSRAADA